MNMQQKKHVTLMYLEAGRQFDMGKYLSGDWSGDWYMAALHMPTCEMFSKTATGIADELLAITASSDWLSHNRRAIKTGDIMNVDGVPWVFTKSDCSVSTANTKKLEQWGNILITPLVEGEVCNGGCN
jgi:hypothetical protein